MAGKVLAYDSIEGIQSHYLSRGLPGLNDLERDRHIAGYDRKERLQEFCILGRWIADTCGNFGKIISDSRDERVPADVIHDCPRVMTKDDACRRTGRVAWSGVSSHIPHPGMICEKCERSWHLENAHDALELNGHTKIDCSPFVGMELSLFEKSLVSNVRYTKLFGDFLRSDRFIDLSPLSDQFKDIPKNEHGWVDRKTLGAGYRFHEGDYVLATYFYWRHPACHQRAMNDEAELDVREALLKAGFIGFHLEPIKNEYWGDYPKFAVSPWYAVTTDEAGKLIIGWRKRVLNIEWGKSEALRTVDGYELFEEENVTKGKDHIHAWGWEKATEYLSKLRTAAINKEGP